MKCKQKKIVQMNKKIVHMNKKIVQMNIKIVQMKIKIVQMDFINSIYTLGYISDNDFILFFRMEENGG